MRRWDGMKSRSDTIGGEMLLIQLDPSEKR